MKHAGCCSDCHRERARDLLRAYFVCIASSPRIVMADIFRRVAAMPASQFWVSSSRAAAVVAAIMRGESISSMRPCKRDMFLEIHRRVLLLRSRRPRWSVARLVREVVAQPAPCFYLEPASVRIIILKERKLWFEEKSKKRRHC